MLFRGPSINGLYPFPSSSSPTPPDSQVAFLCVRVNKDVWHSRLGHPVSSSLHRLGVSSLPSDSAPIVFSPATPPLTAVSSSPPTPLAAHAAPPSPEPVSTITSTVSLESASPMQSPMVPVSSSPLQVVPTTHPMVTQGKANKQDHWLKAMEVEDTARQQTKTWTLVPHTPSMNVLPNKWVYHIKQSDGTIERYKARLVANGFHQQPGFDYGETFSPVVNQSTIRLILGLAVHRNWHIRQLDISKCLFARLFIRRCVHVATPVFVDSQFPNYVCKLNRSLYGLKQAPRNDPSQITQLIHHLGHSFSMKDLGSLHYFRAIEASWTTTGLHLIQSKYVLDLLKRTNMLDVKPVSTPGLSSKRLSLHDGDPLPDVTKYCSVVGALQYLTITRSGISFAVNQVRQFMHQPSTIHWIVIKRILCYLKAITFMVCFINLVHYA
ncbi:transposable element gene [Prunus dulcis]|uniref:Transposable element protein n=1 Tax=Prunus dulcis TaxID=3755 RepID=A0A4Y1QNI7_PRUDU|nr:transposable element gene [Prunus dulcis]